MMDSFNLLILVGGALSISLYAVYTIHKLFKDIKDNIRKKDNNQLTKEEIFEKLRTLKYPEDKTEMDKLLDILNKRRNVKE